MSEKKPVKHRAEHNNRVALCAKMLSEGWKKHQVYGVLKEKYGIRSWQCQKYVTRARRYLHDLAQKSRDQAKGESLEFYLSVVRDQTADIETRLRAQARIDKILGLEEPMQVNQLVHGSMENFIRVEYQGDDWQRRPAFDLEVKEPNAN